MNNQQEILRGQIYYANLDPALGSEQGGIRPVLILQNNLGNAYKTYYIALNYLDRTADLNAERISNITGQLRPLESRINRLSHCVKQLRPDHERVIVGLYFDGKNIRALASEMHISERTVQRYRDAAIDELTEMYEVLTEAGLAPE